MCVHQTLTITVIMIVLWQDYAFYIVLLIGIAIQWLGTVLQAVLAPTITKTHWQWLVSRAVLLIITPKQSDESASLTVELIASTDFRELATIRTAVPRVQRPISQRILVFMFVLLGTLLNWEFVCRIVWMGTLIQYLKSASKIVALDITPIYLIVNVCDIVGFLQYNITPYKILDLAWRTVLKQQITTPICLDNRFPISASISAFLDGTQMI